jgi:hypothetical protein
MAPHVNMRNHHTTVTLPHPHQLPYRRVRWTDLTPTPNNLLNIIEAELIGILARCNNPQIIAQGIFLEELLCEILQVSLRKGNVRRNCDFVLVCCEL